MKAQSKTWLTAQSPTTTPAQVLDVNLSAEYLLENSTIANGETVDVCMLHTNVLWLTKIRDLWTLYTVVSEKVWCPSEPHTPRVTMDKALVPAKEKRRETFLFITSILTCVGLLTQIYLSWKLYKLKQMVLILTIQHFPLAQSKPLQDFADKAVCTQTPWLTYIMTAITIIGAIIYLWTWRRLALWTGPRVSKSCEVYLTVQYGPYYVPIKPATVVGYPNQITCSTKFEGDQLQNQEGLLWDTLRIDWKEVKINKEEVEIAVPHTMQINFPYNMRLKRSLKANDCTPELFAEIGNNWFPIPTIDCWCFKTFEY